MPTFSLLHTLKFDHVRSEGLFCALQLALLPSLPGKPEVELIRLLNMEPLSSAASLINQGCLLCRRTQVQAVGASCYSSTLR